MSTAARVWGKGLDKCPGRGRQQSGTRGDLFHGRGLEQTFLMARCKVKSCWSKVPVGTAMMRMLGGRAEASASLGRCSDGLPCKILLMMEEALPLAQPANDGQKFTMWVCVHHSGCNRWVHWWRRCWGEGRQCTPPCVQSRPTVRVPLPRSSSWNTCQLGGTHTFRGSIVREIRDHSG